MAINPQILASVMQRMQPQGMNAPVPPGPPPPGGPMPGPGMQQGMPVQMQGTMMMKPAQPPMPAPGMQPQQGAQPGFNRPGAGMAPPSQLRPL